ncbi:alpha-ketoglutarate-dependent dioxygenase AlkB [Williamsia sp. 1138]|uniref:alpha-ketoglutarate-dependent dioxygenase AlkB n=1 Tax=Williamsia sp. 1138 TaxID=1903117 RepID=UPI000A1214C8|nr:alpha-ketoglutarate-dependent dioxygenase AlkB [Williamsia sp. 1138]OZG29661.1 alpha-ketoglutarate-dependent dioxygenase AlkB [Williamsia sp. 1138]
MHPGRQASLFEEDAAEDADSNSMIGVNTDGLSPLPGAVARRTLSAGAWVDLRPGWVTAADELFDRLESDAAWREERRVMYDRVLPVPRLVSHYEDRRTFPHPLLETCRGALTDFYRDELPEGFSSAGLCLYRNGNDSVAWHGDTIGRGKTEDTMVAILSLGSPRPLLLRPTGGGRSLKFTVGHGDLLVMGGSCQRTWQHAVPKTTGVGPRISVQFRPHGVR